MVTTTLGAFLWEGKSPIGWPLDYEVKSFDFSERALTQSEISSYNDAKITNNYDIYFRKQEQNSKQKNSILLLNCIRKVNNQLFLITEFQINLEKSSNTTTPKKSTFSNQSVLNNGSNWFKLGNFEAGIYKIDYNFLINNSIIDHFSSRDFVCKIPK